MTHAIVWIDHTEGRIFHVRPDAADESTILSPPHHIHRHPKGRGVVSRIVGVEPADHPTGGEIVAHARRYFKASDRMGSVGVNG
jgi:hypothetical protein